MFTENAQKYQKEVQMFCTLFPDFLGKVICIQTLKCVVSIY